MTEPLSVQDAIRQSATDVDLDELSRRGLRKVKVLDKQTVFRLIDEAVNRVVEERLAAATAQEREQIQAEARGEFQRLVKERQQQLDERVEQKVQAATAEATQAASRQVQEYQARIAELEAQVAKGNVPGASGVDPEVLGAMIRDAVAQAAPAQSAPAGGELAALQQSIESLANKVHASGGGGSKGIEAPSEDALQAFFSRASSSDDVESNINNVEVKNAKAGGVNKNLAKLRSLKKGSE